MLIFVDFKTFRLNQYKFVNKICPDKNISFISLALEKYREQFNCSLVIYVLEQQLDL